MCGFVNCFQSCAINVLISEAYVLQKVSEKEYKLFKKKKTKNKNKLNLHLLGERKEYFIPVQVQVDKLLYCKVGGI